MDTKKITFGPATETERYELELNCGYPVKEETVFVARIGNKPIGFAWIGKGVFRKIVMAKEFRGEGNAQKLLQEAMKFYFKKHKNVKLARVKVVHEGLVNGKKREGSLERWVMLQGAMKLRTRDGTHAFVRPQRGESLIEARKRYLTKAQNIPARKLRRK